MEKSVIISLDFKDFEQTKCFVEKFNQQLYVKVGMELFYSTGEQVILYLKEKNHKIFLDLKLHDIPNTVRCAMKSLARLQVDMVNVHASGGCEMMKQAIVGLEEGSKNGKRPICIAVTQLTSTSQNIMTNQILIDKKLDEVILQYAIFSKKSGLDGVVCSALESSIIHNNLGNDFITCTPGIRLLTDDWHDQSRVVTPKQARDFGSNFIVVGRSITKSENPVDTYNLVSNQFLY